jgi:hypothetical protein
LLSQKHLEADQGWGLDGGIKVRNSDNLFKQLLLNNEKLLIDCDQSLFELRFLRNLFEKLCNLYEKSDTDKNEIERVRGKFVKHCETLRFGDYLGFGVDGREVDLDFRDYDSISFNREEIVARIEMLVVNAAEKKN